MAGKKKEVTQTPIGETGVEDGSAELDDVLDQEDELDVLDELDEIVDEDDVDELIDLEAIDLDAIDVDDIEIDDVEVIDDVEELDSVEELAEAEHEDLVDTTVVIVDDEDADDEEEADDDEVESALDDILRERFVGVEIEPDDDGEAEESGDTLVRVRPRQPGEFVCQSCFLLKSMTQLADTEKMFCRDCV
ncbi:MAG: hypothetical protein ACYDHP_06540 [Ferrimicrobium sp.]